MCLRGSAELVISMVIGVKAPHVADQTLASDFSN